jgi:amino acid adenylation domain-containing protein
MMTAYNKIILSPNQRGIWFHNQLDPHSPVYNNTRSLLLEGSLNTDALTKSFQLIIDRHEAYRMSFHFDGNEPYAQISQSIEFILETIDITDLPEDSQAIRVSELLKVEATTVFDIEQAPLLRVRLVKHHDARHTLFISTQHLISDGWSALNLYRELETIYNHLVTGSPLELPDISMGFTEYIEWKRQHFSGERREKALAFWREKLANNAPLPLPHDAAPGKTSSFAGEWLNFPIPDSLRQKIDNLCKQHRMTYFVLFAAVLKTLLYRFSGAEHVAIGTPFGNRLRLDAEKIHGFLVNTIPITSEINPRTNFLELMQTLRRATLEALNFQDTSLETLIEELKPMRVQGQNPFFQVVLTVEDQEQQLPGLAGITKIEQALGEKDAAMFDLTFVVQAAPNKPLKCKINYAKHLFEPATIEQMQIAFLTILNTALNAPETRIIDLPVLDRESYQKIVVDWNQTQQDWPMLPVHQKFEEHAARAPQTPALVYRDEILSYGELNQHANQITNYLQSQGAKKGDLIALYGHSDFEIIAAMIGIVKLGCAYVPLGADYPRDRISNILDQTQPAAIITQSVYVPNLPDGLINIIEIDKGAWRNSSEMQPDIRVHPLSPLCVIFTSGTTGQPKGVVVHHTGAYNYIRSFRLESLPDRPYDRLHTKPLTFDVSIAEIFQPLNVGKGLVIAEIEKQADSDYLLGLAEKYRVTSWSIAIALLRIILMGGNYKKLEAIHHVIVGGDALTAALLQDYMSKVGTAISNLYGPTETTITVSGWECEPGKPVSIGKPYPNNQFYVLNEFLNPVPIGVWGELYIAGVNVSHGYWQKPGQTAQKFLPDPFSTTPGRMFKSGDKVRWLADGNIEFFGRIDNMIKLRGYRIELGEITSVLNTHPQVEQTKTLVHETGGNKFLVSYVQAQESGAPTSADLTRHCQTRLPSYMVPSAIIVLNKFPLRPNGKIDHQKFPEPEITRLVKAAPVIPQTETEQVLQSIWQDVIQIDAIGVTDDFFVLGGHSLLAARILTRIQEMLNIHVPMHRFFSSPTIRELAAWIDNEHHSNETHLDKILSEIENLSDNKTD